MTGDETSLLFANEAFYNAFAERDMAAMVALWSHQAEVGCIHPGWPPLFGLEAVLDSWERILSNPAAPEIETAGAEAMCWGDVGVVVCYEKIENSYLIATNTFIREGRQWRLVYHQAGPVSTPPPGTASNDDADDDDEDEVDEAFAEGEFGDALSSDESDNDDEDDDSDDEAPDDDGPGDGGPPPSRSIH